MHYILRLNKSKTDRVDRIEASDMSEAKSFLMSRKRMDEQTFDKLYLIEKENPSQK